MRDFVSAKQEAAELLAHLLRDAAHRVRMDLLQLARQLRQADSPQIWRRLLLQACKPFAEAVVLVEVDQDADQFVADSIRVPRREAPALQTTEPQVLLASPRELSAPLLRLLGAQSGEKIAIIPQPQPGPRYLLLARGDEADLTALELILILAADAPRTEPAALTARTPLVQIQAAPTRGKSEGRYPSWHELSPEDRALHLRAQRWARTRVAKIVLQSGEAIEQGRSSLNLYDKLKEEIDAQRDEFRRQFQSRCPTMVDYLHLELVRTLAQGNPAALGESYPGPLV